MSARAKPRRQSLLKARQAILRGPAIVPADPLSFCFSLRQSIVDTDRDTKNKVSMAPSLRRQENAALHLAAEWTLPTRGGASRTERTSNRQDEAAGASTIVCVYSTLSYTDTWTIG
jgi:hypothetical protein